MMNNLKEYITEKFKISKDINYKSDIEKFIDSFDDKDKITIVHLIEKCLNELKQYEDWEDHWCYITKSKDHTKIYLWSSNPDNEHYNIGDKTEFGNAVLFIVKKGDELPDKYENI